MTAKAKGLTEALWRFDCIAKSCIAPRPGSNHLPALELISEDGQVAVEGEELDALHRLGWLQANPDPRPIVVEDSDEWGGIDADHLWTITPAGRLALQEAGHE